MTNPASSRRHTETPLTPDVPPNGDATTGHLDGRSLPENGSHSNADEERHHYVPDTTQADTESEAPSDDGTADLDWGDDLTDQGDIDMDAVVVEAEILDDDSIQDPEADLADADVVEAELVDDPEADLADADVVEAELVDDPEADLADADMVEARLVEDPKAEPPTTPTSQPTVSAPLAADSAAADYSAADEYSIAPDPDEPEPGLTLRDQPAEQRSRRRFGRGRRTQRGSSPSTNSLDAEQTGATSTPFPPRLGSQEKTSAVSMFDLDREPTSPAHPLPPDQITSSPSEPPLLMDPLPTEPLQVEPLQPPEPPTRPLPQATPTEPLPVDESPERELLGPDPADEVEIEVEVEVEVSDDNEDEVSNEIEVADEDEVSNEVEVEAADEDEVSNEIEVEDEDEVSNEIEVEDEDEVSNEIEVEDEDEDEVDAKVEPQPASDENGRDEPNADEEKVGVLELRQIAGLTAGVVMDLVQSSYDFAEGTDVVGFSIRVDDHDRAVVVPGAAPARLDSIAVNEPTPIGSGVLDVGTARFIIRPKKERRRATDWLDETTRIDQPEPVIVVPSNMTEPAPAPGRRRGLRRRKQPPTDQASDVATWEFIESIRQTRAEMADRERYHYPDPADLVIRAAHEAPNLGVRPPGHPLFAKIGVMVADQHWLPNFDNIQDIPESIGTQIQPLLSLPSVPVVADLLVGPLGIVGTRAAAMAAARHIMVSLFGLSTQDLHLHIASSEVRADAWQWARTISSDQPVDTDDGFPVVIVDGMENFGVGGFSHQEALNHEVGVVILVDSVEDLPSYCGTVLQIDPAGTALLTNHLGNVIKGTPIGISTATAASIASDLLHVLTPRRSE